MTMEKLEIVEFILSALSTRDEMVDFQQISVLKEQMADGTFSLLSFQQASNALIDLRMSSHAGTPVNPVGIKHRALTLNFDMPLNRGVTMSC
jgi:hypothetical protein